MWREVLIIAMFLPFRLANKGMGEITSKTKLCIGIQAAGAVDAKRQNVIIMRMGLTKFILVRFSC